MASSTPKTPDNSAPRRMLMNRSVTAPIRSSPTSAKSQPEIGASEGVETLYTHPDANIVKFTIGSSRPSSSSPGRQGGSQPLLPWTNTTERTVAAGPLQVYRVPGSVSFLNSGNLLHAILPRSQCWCVDGLSKFALRVLPDTYYRIELPGETEADKEEVERLKLTLQKVCFYERTPCPFERGFEVEAGEEGEVDLDLEVRGKRRKRESHGPAKRWTLDRQYSWKPEGWEPGDGEESGNERSGSREETPGLGSSAGSEDDSEEVSGKEDGAEEEKAELADKVRDLKVSTPSRVRTARNMFEQRSVSSPVVPTMLQSPPSRPRTRLDRYGTVEVAEPASGGAVERPTTRLRTFQAIPTDMPPSPPDSSAGPEHADVPIDGSAEQPDKVTAESTDESTVEDAPQPEETTGGAGNDEAVAALANDRNGEASSPAGPESIPEPQKTPSEDPPRTPTLDKPQVNTTQPTPESPAEGLRQAPRTPDNTVEPSRKPSDPFSAGEPLTHSPSRSPRPEDPFAAIQARILARRSIGGTTSFHPPATRHSTSSSSSAATVSSTVSRRSKTNSHPHNPQQQQAFASAMVKKACNAFLGPPAHLVAMMLRIAARFARGAFGVDGLLYVESPVGVRKRVPGTYDVWAESGGELDGLDADDDAESEMEEWEEDDFGVPLRSPVRLASMSSLRSGSPGKVRERGGKGLDVD